MKNKAYTDHEINHLKELTLSKFDGVNQAVDKAQEGIEKRLEGMNEFREQLNTQAGTFVTRKELWFGLSTAVGLAIAIMELLK